MPDPLDRTIPPDFRCSSHEAFMKETFERLTRVETKVDTLSDNVNRLGYTMRTGFHEVKDQLRELSAREDTQNCVLGEVKVEQAKVSGAAGFVRAAIPWVISAIGIAAGVLMAIFL